MARESVERIQAARQKVQEAQAAVVAAQDEFKAMLADLPGVESLAIKLWAFVTVTTEPTDSEEDERFHHRLINDQIFAAECWVSLNIEEERMNFRAMALKVLEIAEKEKDSE